VRVQGSGFRVQDVFKGKYFQRESRNRLSICFLLARYWGTSLIKKRLALSPYRRPVPRSLWCYYEGMCFLMSEVPL